ncbi:polyprenyl synthetase family protein [Schaalia sp. 19OD2882]|uniref:polyprenyl synthetase family protein n=1 Tax=Schaalia sp. 19OD2882 TaxID=2794089 RepID=UPI001C1F02A7|nr:polyprenyl synthetase family protein [Schaalia sp. 19OD2882]QWW18872.1 polyprenyl synthetase family protein [Schaalia sp. 19OD2882]
MSTLRDAFAQDRTRVDRATHDALVDVLDTLELPDAAQPMAATAIDSARSGKRFRGLLALLGGQLAPGLTDAPVLEANLDLLAAALELYQASALAHDDVIDHAPTRRGRPTPHVRLSAIHRESGWSGSAEDFGTAGAILVGDLLFSAAERAMARQCAVLPRANASAVMGRYTLMHAEVAMGQYLDVRAEQVPLDHEEAACVDVEAALKVITHKSARYSVVHPAALGACAAGVSDDRIRVLEQVLTPWGIAFQLRDDDLGVFGDPATTGKPAGDDLVEGKRTVLLGLAWRHASAAERALLASGVGRADLSGQMLDDVRTVVEARGRGPHEAMIRDLVDEGDRVLATSGFCDDARRVLAELSGVLTARDA